MHVLARERPSAAKSGLVYIERLSQALALFTKPTSACKGAWILHIFEFVGAILKDKRRSAVESLYKAYHAETGLTPPAESARSGALRGPLDLQSSAV